MIGKLALLVSVEMFVLIAAIFLLVYITKQQVSKWFTYSSVAIVITILAMMICTMCCVMCCGHHGKNKMEKECRFEDVRCNKTMMIRMNAEGGGPEEMLMHGGNCCKERGEGCEMEEKCEMKKEDCCKGKDGMMKKEIIIDTLPKKEVIIKKK